MDTFSGVSQIAGRLNSILGSSVFNPLQLLNMNEAQRAEAIRAGIQSSPMLAGRDINDLKKFELKSIASSLGMSVLETRKYLTQQGDVRQELEKTIDKRTELAGGKDGLSNLPATNNELARMQDTIRNMRFAAENLTIDAQRLASRATGDMIVEGAGKFIPGGAAAARGREIDVVRILEQLSAGQITMADIEGASSIDELLQQADKASDRAGTGRVLGTFTGVDPRSAQGKAIGGAIAAAKIGKSGIEAIAELLPGGMNNPKIEIIKKVLGTSAELLPAPGDPSFAPLVTGLMAGGEAANNAIAGLTGGGVSSGPVNTLANIFSSQTPTQQTQAVQAGQDLVKNVFAEVFKLDPSLAARYIVNGN